MAPNHESQKADRTERVGHRAVSVNRLARERRKDVRCHTHARQSRDIDVWMNKRPEQMLPKNRRAAFVVQQRVTDDLARWNKEARTSRTIQNQQDSRRQQHSKCQQPKNCRNEPSPNRQRHPHQRHSRRPKIDCRRNEIQSAQKRSYAEERDAHNPHRLPESLTWSGNFAESAKRRVSRPSADWRATRHKERRN